MLTAMGLSPGGIGTVHIYTQTIHRTTQQFWKCAGRTPSYTLTFALQLRKKHGKNLSQKERIELTVDTIFEISA
jgi:uncharacterized integral membrane protein